MPIQAALPDGTHLEFPDGTDPSVIDKTVKNHLGVGKPATGDQMPQNPAAMTPAEQKYPNAVPSASKAYGGQGGQNDSNSTVGNMVRGAGERGADLVGSFLSGLGQLADTGEKKLTDLTGINPAIMWDGGKLHFTMHAKPSQTHTGLKKTGAELSATDLGYKPEYTWDRLKKNPTAGNLLGFVAEQGIRSTPDMAAVLANAPSYVLSRAREIGQQRAQNDGRSKVEVKDMVQALPSAIVSTALQRVGAETVFGVGHVKGLNSLLKEAGKAAAVEGGVNAAQESSDYAGATVGTKHGFHAGEMGSRAAAGAVAGAGFGGMVRGATGATEAGVHAIKANPEHAAGSDTSASQPTPPDMAQPQGQTGNAADSAPSPDASAPDVGHSSADTATKAQRASAGEIPLDQVVPEKKVADMSPQEMQHALLTSDITGLPNRRAYVEAPKKAGRVSADVDSLKWINDNVSHDAGNALLSAVGKALKDEGVDAYHISGDEFLAQADSVDAAKAQMERVSQRLEGATLRVTSPDGKVLEVTPRISYGAAGKLSDAESQLAADKARREATGERAPRGERPPTVRDVTGQGQGAGDRSQPVQGGGHPAAAVEAMHPGDVQAMNPGANYQGMLHEAAPPQKPTIDLSGGRTVKVPDHPIRRRDIIRSMERAFGNKIYNGRIKGKSMLGFHRKSNNEIRTKRVHDLEVTAHELAHWIDDRYPAFAKAYKAQPYSTELKGVSYDSKSASEGFAEFVRLYMTQEGEAQQRAPKFFHRFQQLLEQTGLKDKVNAVQRDMHAWYYQGAKSRLASKMGQTQSIRQRLDGALHRAGDRFVSEMLDGLNEIAVAEKDLTGYINDATLSPYKAFRLVAGARGTVKSIFHYGTIGWNAKGDIEFTGPSLEDVFSPIADNLDNAKLYFIARRAQELKKQGREHLIENDEIAAGLKEGQKDPRLPKAFDEWLAFNSRMMDFYEQSGIVSAESRKAMEEANQSYVPFHRVMESLQGKESTHTSSSFHRLKGGTQNLGDVFDNIEQSVATLTRTALINRAKQLAYDMVDQSKNGAYYATKIPRDTKPVSVDEGQLIDRIVKGFGIDPSAYRAYLKDGIVPSGWTPDAMAKFDQIIESMRSLDQFTTFFQHGQAPQGHNLDSVMRAGKTDYYEIGDPLWQIAMAHFGPKNINMALKIAGGFSNTLRRGVTSMPSFLIPNLVRDGTNAIMFSRGGFKGRIPFAGALHGWADSIRKDDTYWRAMANGIGFSSTVHAEVEHSVERFYQREGINYKSVIDTPKKLLEKWDSISSAFEYGTRLGEFRQVEKRGGSAREAALAGREISTDFSMHGASQTMAALRMMVPFMNTRIEGLYKIVREAGVTKERNGSLTGMAAALAIRGISLITIPSLALWAWNNWDPERRKKYQALPDWVRDMHWVIFIPFRDAPLLMPKPFELGALFGSVPERMADAATQKDHEDLGKALMWILGNQLSLNPTPQFINPVVQDVTNKNFLNMPIVPPDLQEVDPVEQYRPWTSETAIKLGKLLGVSPMRVEHYLRGYFGTLGAQALAAADFITHDPSIYGAKPAAKLSDYPVVRRFTGKSPQTSTRQQQEWYDFLSAVHEANNTVNKIVSEGRNPNAYLQEHPRQKFLYGVAQQGGVNNVERTISDLRRAEEQVRTSKTMSPEEKRRNLDEIQREMNAVYRQGAKMADAVSSQAGR